MARQSGFAIPSDFNPKIQTIQGKVGNNATLIFIEFSFPQAPNSIERN